MLPFTSDELEAAVADGRVTRRPHSTLPLDIYNYSPEVQYSNRWDAVTLNCRGLILDRDYNIIARPWQKFFNLGQVNLPIQFDTPVEVMDKMDGSLGILYPTKPGHFSIATRGSFESEQALTATAIWYQDYHDYYNDLAEAEVLKDYTVLFEIIYPQNRIVLDYGDMQDLVLLGGVETKTGYYIGPESMANMIAWPGPVVDVMPFNTLSDALANMGRKNKEGYVVRAHNFLVKVKEPDYVDLHRLVTNASPKTVWEQLKLGKSKSEVVSAFPDEFHDYIGSMVDPLLEQFEYRYEEIRDAFSQLVWAVHQKFGTEATRAQYASVFKKSKEARYMFLMLDNRPIRDVLWAELRPKESPIRLESDA